MIIPLYSIISYDANGRDCEIVVLDHQDVAAAADAAMMMTTPFPQ